MIYSIRYWLGRKLNKLSGWLLRGYPGFVEINYNGEPVKQDLTQYRWTDGWDREHITGILPDGEPGSIVTNPGYRLEDIFAEPPKDKK